MILSQEQMDSLSNAAYECSPSGDMNRDYEYVQLSSLYDGRIVAVFVGEHTGDLGEGASSWSYTL